MRTTSLYDRESGLVIVRDESMVEVATLLVPNYATPVSLGARLKKIGGHFYYVPERGAMGEPQKVESVIWNSTTDFAAWLTGYLKFFGTRRRPVALRTGFVNVGSIELLPTGSRPDGITFYYTMRPQASRTKDGVHVNLSVMVDRHRSIGYGQRRMIFDGNLHKFIPVEVQGNAHSFLEIGRLQTDR